PQSARELQRRPARSASKTARVQPARGPRVLTQAGLPALLGLQSTVGSHGFSPSVDQASDALEARADEALRANSSSARTRATQLVRSPRPLRARRYRGFQQQGPNYDTKSLRLSNLRTRRNRPVSRAPRPTRTRLDHPQIS